MSEKRKLIDNLPEILGLPERQFPPRTPHTYAHIGEQALAEVVELFPDAPQTATIYRLPGQ